jgi:hypothetical protein
VSSRARFRGLGVFGHLAAGDVGQPPFDAAQRFHAGLAGGQLAAVIGAAFGVVAQLHDGHDVQHPVDAPVPGPRQPVTLLLARGGIDGRGAVPGGKVAAVSETGDVTDVTGQPGGAGRADAIEVLQAAAGGSDQLGQLGVGGLDFPGRWRRAR